MGLLGLAKGQSGRRHVLQVCVGRCKYVFSRSPLREVVLRREVSAGAHLSLHRMAVVELRVSLEVHLELGHALFAVLEASGRLLLLLRSEGGAGGASLLRWYLLGLVAVVGEAFHLVTLVLVHVGGGLRCVVAEARLLLG